MPRPVLTGKTATAPFVLLDDQRPGAHSRLYVDPLRVLVADTLAEVEPVLAEVRAATSQGLYVAGFLSYDAGAALEPAVGPLGRDSSVPLAWFGVFAGWTAVEAPDALLPDPDGAWLSPVRPELGREAYAEAFAAVHRHIAAGDIYQANLTFRAHARYAGSPEAIYAGLRSRAAAPYGALVWTGSAWVLSCSPELFVEVSDRHLTTRPMKGTATRGADPATDAAAIAHLRSDPKQQAENVMIVDLLRNDLGRVAEVGSVAVPELFTVETYPSVHQLTSTVTATLRSGLDVVDLLRAGFPCGSVTGAPKIRAMQVIAEVESSPRGLYCGSIGRIDPSGDAAFNVAIRTLILRDGIATVGLGSGIVADSTLDSEWDECLAKGAFLDSGRSLRLLETMRAEPEGIVRLAYHLDRLARSAAALGFAYDRGLVDDQLRQVTYGLTQPARLRLTLGVDGDLSLELLPLPEISGPWSIAVAPLPVDPDDVRLRHKTTDRGFHEHARMAAGCDEVVYVRTDGLVTEGSFTSVYVPRDGVLLTPRLESGLLDSVLRRELLDTGQAQVADLTVADLDGDFFVGNSLRGLVAARLTT